ncbi:hypothetical protein [Thermoflavimicrobium dichotomicum]|uniref:Uncharacterized protein n=1 Tax=Thermoflavimicrobium dichotomicum TaxID=46223 RepID=A0A1I3UTE8_9BACL|nr:hypothetical protein [Thermoflavimicrobium dichotomicum]SFJ86594.1 hypothetical protein SAMN05421852_12816 [Thermoflavimicrobium dichotomicum]
MNHWKDILLRSSIVTAIAVNMMLGGMLLAREQVYIEKAVPSFAGPAEPHLQTEYAWELYKASIEEPYIVEHYKEYEYTYEKNGRLISKRPTNQHQYLRYWRDHPKN